MSKFQTNGGKVPFPRSTEDWMQNGLSAEAADHKMKQEVFGHDYQTDKSGNPIEKGKGSAAQPTAQHQQALMIAQDAEVSRKMRMGWHPGIEQSFNPKEPKRRKKQTKKKTASAPAEGTA